MVYVAKFHDLEVPSETIPERGLGERSLVLLGTPEGIDRVPLFQEKLVVMGLSY